ncbi:hypothetical protein [Pectobacterium odoriferum]|uniref:hypothetical protein n=1 Tax=Pectobacterium odoriferum TaxID=78398 RepID=UPI000CD16416|nr:hypothetical protein [Pectobacterium odoriferum]POD90263.1 hypothetical protein BV925_18500 [Pectobacterium odoriferum]
MASTDLITYLNYISTWDTESDSNIDQLISEQSLFANLGDFESDSIIDSEFDMLDDLACEVRDLTIAADATQMAADAAAIASIWTFGLGMAVYASLEVAEGIERAVISSKSKDLNAKLGTIDSDISSRISPNVQSYVSKYKENNNLINSKAPQGLDTRTCRANLMQFMAQVQRKQGKLDANTFREYAASARIVYNCDEINKVYDALDELNFSDKSDADVKKFLNVLVGLNLPSTAKYGMTLVTSVSLGIMQYKLKIANSTIEAQCKDAGIPVEECDATAFETMDFVGKFATVITVIMSVVDIVLNILDIVDVVEQCKKMCDQLNGPIKGSYKSYFNGIKEASQQYKAAIGG